jgi:hypothetical protein
MSASINFHGPYEYRPEHFHRDSRVPTDYVSFGITSGGTSLHLYFDSRAECDALVKAALAARDLLPGPEAGPPCGTPLAHRTGGCTCTEQAGGPAPLPHVHLPVPGECTCGAHVTADGTVVPAVAL